MTVVTVALFDVADPASYIDTLPLFDLTERPTMTRPAPRTDVTVLCNDPVGILAACDGFVYYLTPCCRASAKGSAMSENGVVCRKCYRDVDPMLGMGWASTDEQAWTEWADAWHRAEDRNDAGNPAVIDRMTAAIKARALAA